MAGALCPICSESEQSYLLASKVVKLTRCAGCGLISNLNHAGRNAVTFGVSSAVSPSEFSGSAVTHAKRIAQLVAGKDILLIGPETQEFGRALARHGMRATQTNAEHLTEITDLFDCVIFVYCFERFEDPVRILEFANSRLRSRGVLSVLSQTIESPYGQRAALKAAAFDGCNRHYFSRKTLQLVLEKTGFASIWVAAGNDKDQERIAEPTLITALKREHAAVPQLSIVMPVYNEKATVSDTLAAVLAKDIRGIDTKEVIVVESNSTDGTRELVRRFEGTPGLRIIYEDAPRGKGHAVRTGFEAAAGDIILIQDADSEYDINDYDELLKPILDWKQLFVLGSRHQGDWKIRSFSNQPFLSMFFNLGQIIFTWLINTLYGQSLTDPFTMYKIFRRECLFGLKFECNRFDFDHELVIKLVRKGCAPYEVPVNYWSRTYSEGKKVTIVGDPITWLKADFKFRFVSPYITFETAYRKTLTGDLESSVDAQLSMMGDESQVREHSISRGGRR